MITIYGLSFNGRTLDFGSRSSRFDSFQPKVFSINTFKIFIFNFFFNVIEIESKEYNDLKNKIFVYHNNNHDDKHDDKHNNKHDDKHNNKHDDKKKKIILNNIPSSSTVESRILSKEEMLINELFNRFFQENLYPVRFLIFKKEFLIIMPNQEFSKILYNIFDIVEGFNAQYFFLKPLCPIKDYNNVEKSPRLEKSFIDNILKVHINRRGVDFEFTIIEKDIFFMSSNSHLLESVNNIQRHHDFIDYSVIKYII
jgi:hypothetical protein